MSLKAVFRLFAVPLTILTLAWALALPAAAGGEPPVIPVNVSSPTVSLDAQDQVVVTVTVTCWDAAVIEGQEAYVAVWVNVGQKVAGGGAFVETHCAVEPQVLTLTIASATNIAFHPGQITGIIEFEVITQTSAVHGIGEINEILLPVEVGA